MQHIPYPRCPTRTRWPVALFVVQLEVFTDVRLCHQQQGAEQSPESSAVCPVGSSLPRCPSDTANGTRTGCCSPESREAPGAIPATSPSSAGPVPGHKHHKPGEQAEPGPAPPGGRRRVLGRGPVPRPLPLLRAPRGHLPQLSLLPGPGPVQRPLCLPGGPAPTALVGRVSASRLQATREVLL